MRAQDRRLLGAAASSIWLSLAALYLWCPVHRFPPARPFEGSRWYNPYGSVTPATPWQKVNLHAHARAWSGLTNGRGSADDVLRSYRAMGYGAAPVSNYQAITRTTASDSNVLTVYEQGYNLRKVHFLAVGPRRVDWLDYPLLQGRDEEQHRIDRLRASAALVIIAHPRLRNALPDADLRALTGYTAIEIGSYASRDEEAWNVALDAGRPVWAVANDDTHSADAPNEAGEYWSMIAAPNVDAKSLKGALSAGRAYAVFGFGGEADIALRSLSIAGDTLSVVFDGAPADLRLVGTKGRVLGEETGRREARWVLPCDAPWVRVVARTTTTQLFLQPVLRSEDGALPRRIEARVAIVPTVVRRVMALVLLFIAVVAWVSHGAADLTRTEAGRRRPRFTLQDAA